jgi:hypothetical protein
MHGFVGWVKGEGQAPQQARAIERSTWAGRKNLHAQKIDGWLGLLFGACEHGRDGSTEAARLSTEAVAAMQGRTEDCEEQYLGAAKAAQDARDCGDAAIRLYSQADADALTVWKVVSMTSQAAADPAPASVPPRRVLATSLAAVIAGSRFA